MQRFGWSIAVVHSFYSTDQPSGENEMVNSEVEALQRAGHHVRLHARRTDDLTTQRGYRLRAFAATATGRGHSPQADIADQEPDVVHIHNLFPNFGRTWLRKIERPVVVTLHNYRPICAKATLYRDNHLCTDCFGGPLPGLRYACYRGTRRATLPLTIAQPSVQRDVLGRADRLVTLSPLQRDFYVQAGFDPAKIVEIPNFLPAPLDPGPGEGGESWLYAGRITREKGVDELLRAWPSSVPLVAVGTGASLDEMRALARGKQVEFVGKVDRSHVVELMRHSRGVAFPSRGPEPFGLVYVEALAAGTPVLANRPAAAADFIERDATGAAINQFTEDAVRDAHEQFADLRAHVRSVFDEQYTEDAHVAALTRLYRSLF